MKNNLSLNKDIDEVVNKKLADCKCNPCTCSDQTKDKYFQELKDILTKYNQEYLFLNSAKINYFGQSLKQIPGY
jgi:hypothetical protein